MLMCSLHRQFQKGFTLFEVMLAMAVSTLICVSLFNFMHQEVIKMRANSEAQQLLLVTRACSNYISANRGALLDASTGALRTDNSFTDIQIFGTASGTIQASGYLPSGALSGSPLGQEYWLRVWRHDVPDLASSRGDRIPVLEGLVYARSGDAIPEDQLANVALSGGPELGYVRQLAVGMAVGGASSPQPGDIITPTGTWGFAAGTWNYGSGPKLSEGHPVGYTASSLSAYTQPWLARLDLGDQNLNTMRADLHMDELKNIYTTGGVLYMKYSNQINPLTGASIGGIYYETPRGGIGYTYALDTDIGLGMIEFHMNSHKLILESVSNREPNVVVPFVLETSCNLTYFNNFVVDGDEVGFCFFAYNGHSVGSMPPISPGINLDTPSMMVGPLYVNRNMYIQKNVFVTDNPKVDVPKYLPSPGITGEIIVVGTDAGGGNIELHGGTAGGGVKIWGKNSDGDLGTPDVLIAGGDKYDTSCINGSCSHGNRGWIQFGPTASGRPGPILSAPYDSSGTVLNLKLDTLYLDGSNAAIVTGGMIIMLGCNHGSSAVRPYFSTSGPSGNMLCFGIGTDSMVRTFDYYFNSHVYVYGDIFSSGKMYAKAKASDSDARLKKDIQPLTHSLEKVLQLQGDSFLWKEEEHNKDGRSFGFIAQEIQKIFPNLVGPGPALTGSSERYLSLNYEGLIAPVVEAIKEFYKKFTDLATKVNHEIARLVQRLETDEQKIQRLETRVAQMEKEFDALKRAKKQPPEPEPAPVAPAAPSPGSPSAPAPMMGQ